MLFSKKNGIFKDIFSINRMWLIYFKNKIIIKLGILTKFEGIYTVEPTISIVQLGIFFAKKTH